MKSKAFVLERYDADEGMVFDYKEPRYSTVIEIVDGEEIEKQVEVHLNAKTLFIGVGDSIENYIEVPAPVVAE